ncbi:unnamed protein product [Cunninghamella echinulata]
MAIIVPSEYGYVLATSAVSALQIFGMGIAVGAARRKAQIPYPYVYAERSEAEKDIRKHVFNCTQRVHQNTLEMFPLFNTLLLIGGIKHPELSAGAGVVYLLGRFIYGKGYSSGRPEKRLYGSIGYVGLITLLYTSGSTIYHLLK